MIYSVKLMNFGKFCKKKNRVWCRGGVAAPPGAGPQDSAGAAAPPGPGPLQSAGARGPAGANPGPRKTLVFTPKYLQIILNFNFR